MPTQRRPAASARRRTIHRPLRLESLEERALMDGSLAFAADRFEATEIRAAAVVTVFRSDSGVGQVTAQFSATPGTATAGSDFTATTGTLTFANNQFSRNITIPVVSDSLAEANETVQLTLSNVNGGTLGSPATAALTILDDDSLTNANTVSLPGEGFNSLQFLRDGRLAQIVCVGQELLYRVRSRAGLWSHELITGDLALGDGYASTDSEPYRDREQAQLLLAGDGTPHVLLLSDFGVEHFRRGTSGWQLVETVMPPGGTFELFDSGFSAALGRDDSLHFILNKGVFAGGTAAGRLVYGTNKTGAWAFEDAADTDTPRGFFRAAFAPRYLSLAVDAQNAAHVAYTPRFENFQNPDGSLRPLSRLAYATNRSGAWATQTLSEPADGSGDAGLGASIAIGPDNQPAIAHFYIERVTSGSAQFSRLEYLARQANGSWQTQNVATAPAGYVAGDGPNFTGNAPHLLFDHVGRPNIAFSDHASEHFPQTGADEFAGQIRHAIRRNGQWTLTTVFPQTAPVINQMVYPTMALSPFELVFAGVRRFDTLSPDNAIESSDYFYETASLAISPQRPELRPFYDEGFYLRHNPDVRAVVAAGGLATGFDHFAQFGHRERRAFSPLFDENFYRSRNPDVAQAVAAGTFGSGYEHFALAGHREGRTASKFFSESLYRRINPDVAQAIANGKQPSGFRHFAVDGRFEGRRFSEFYDEAFYLAANPDVAQAVRQGVVGWGFEHFVDDGQREGRRFSRLFDERVYRAEYPDVAAAVASGALRSGFEHFMIVGQSEGRRSRAVFEEALYLAKNPDVAQAVSQGSLASGFAHFISHGRNEGRRYSPFFDEAFYLATYPDIAQLVQTSIAIRSGYIHYLRFGQFEGRIPVGPNG